MVARILQDASQGESVRGGGAETPLPPGISFAGGWRETRGKGGHVATVSRDVPTFL